MNQSHRYCPSCRRMVPASRAVNKDLPPPWPIAAMMVLPTCPECGDALGPTLEEIAREVADAVEGDVGDE